MFWSLKFKRFEFVSSFDIRISDLKVNLMEWTIFKFYP